MSEIVESIQVAVPLRTAYDQWTQFEEFPRFMEAVERVEQTNDRLTHWTVRVGGVAREFDAEIVEQVPDQRVAWRSVKSITTSPVFFCWRPVTASLAPVFPSHKAKTRALGCSNSLVFALNVCLD